MRELTEFEIANLGFLTRYDLDFGLLEPTSTGLGKNILDATAEYRAFLKRRNIHDYETQTKGKDDKRMVPARVVMPGGEVINAPASLYRPDTKNGDPRVWFSRLKSLWAAGDILVSIWADGHLWALNATKVKFSDAVTSIPAYRDLLLPMVDARESVFEELLEMLRGLSAKGYLPAIKSGDTAIGHLLETELGIKQNSKKTPDYKGVELKSTRALKSRSQTMFARVPDWDLSQLKSSRQILETFGYPRGNDFKLNCTVSARVWNSQGLRLEVNEKSGLLHEISDRADLSRPATWRIEGIQDQLAKKHADTFWLKGQSRKDSSGEHIHFLSAIQTTKPIVQQVAPMLAAGTITVDHLISLKNRRLRERGPLFKISHKHFEELFPEPVFHDLSRE